MKEQSLSRQRHLANILMHIHDHGPARRAFLSDALNIRLNSMNSFMEELVDKKFLKPSDPTKPRGAFEFDTRHHWCFVVGASYDRLMFGAMHMDGQLHHVVSESDSRRSPESFCELVKSHLSRLEATMGYRPLGCGVSMSGLVCNGRVERSLQVGPWAGVDLKDSLEASLGLSVIVENDNRCSTFSLNWFQLTEASKNRSLLVLGLGEGISTALCFGHEPLVGSRGAAGEIGHIPIHQNGKVCSCGKYDCLEAYCSSGQVLKELQRLHPDKLLMTSVDQIYHETQRYPGLLAGVDRVAQDLCRVILPIIASLDLERLVLISESLSYSELVSTALDRHMDQKLVGHECQGLRWKAFGDLSEHRLKGVGGLVLREAFLAGGKV